MQQSIYRHGLIETIREAVAAFDFAICKLTRIQFSAPWRNDRASGC